MSEPDLAEEEVTFKSLVSDEMVFVGIEPGCLLDGVFAVN